jgi:hypothetical protein
MSKINLATGMRASASAQGGADVDMKLVLFIDEEVPNDDCIQILVDLQEGTRRKVLGPANKRGDAVLTVLLAVAPLVDGQFEVEIELAHPDLANGSRSLRLSGDTRGEAKSFRRNVALS